MDQLVLKARKATVRRGQGSAIFIDPECYARMEMLKLRVGMPMTRLAEVLLSYAMDNTIVEGSCYNDENERDENQ